MVRDIEDEFVGAYHTYSIYIYIYIYNIYGSNQALTVLHVKMSESFIGAVHVL